MGAEKTESGAVWKAMQAQHISLMYELSFTYMASDSPFQPDEYRNIPQYGLFVILS